MSQRAVGIRVIVEAVIERHGVDYSNGWLETFKPRKQVGHLYDKVVTNDKFISIYAKPPTLKGQRRQVTDTVDQVDGFNQSDSDIISYH